MKNAGKTIFCHSAGYQSKERNAKQKKEKLYEREREEKPQKETDRMKVVFYW